MDISITSNWRVSVNLALIKCTVIIQKVGTILDLFDLFNMS